MNRFFILIILLVVCSVHVLAAPMNTTKKSPVSPPPKLPTKLPTNTSANAMKLPVNGSDISTEINIAQMLTGSVRAFFNNWSSCVYGRTCGASCVNVSTIDNLDAACQAHDRCLTSRRVAFYQSGSGPCHRVLAAASRAVYNREKKCPWWNLFCKESRKVEVAWSMSTLFTAMAWL